MNIRTALAQEAEQIAGRLEHSIGKVQTELADLEREKANLQAQLHTANLAGQRLLNYPILVGSDFQCPRC